ncbi:MAG: DUF4215 domain-containing protein [Candidatus Peribacteraceae bacterium]|nr:DUF4215 domain-containing protein [Candidatus Peribacteraceae bacterium]
MTYDLGAHIDCVNGGGQCQNIVSDTCDASCKKIKPACTACDAAKCAECASVSHGTDVYECYGRIGGEVAICLKGNQTVPGGYQQTPCSCEASTSTHLECNNRQCVEVQGAGENTCDSDDDCEDDTHLTCRNQQCVEVSGAAENTCESDDECEDDKHLECSNKQCKEVDGAAENTCESDDECEDDTHLACENQQCKSFAGAEENTCNSNDDCEDDTHLECENDQCKIFEGAEENTCNSDDDCTGKHLECENEQCKEFDGAEENTCDSDDECIDIFHLECEDKQCKVFIGAEASTCFSDDDCEEEHLECDGLVCIKVSGPGENACGLVGAQCGLEKHFVCAHSQCEERLGPGPIECDSEDDCEQHLICTQDQCMYMEGPGDDECNNILDCGEETHMECEDDQCVIVEGSGDNECDVAIPCNTHTECEEEQCKVVEGVGENKCDPDKEDPCGVEKHTECIPVDPSTGTNVSFVCAEVDGSGSNDCENIDDCNTHTVCENRQCILKQGVGLSQCRDSRDCPIFSSSMFSTSRFSSVSLISTSRSSFSSRISGGERHLECAGDRCVEVIGPGPDECDLARGCSTQRGVCSTNDQCFISTDPGPNECTSVLECAKHTECQGRQCIIIDGYGANECVDSRDCDPGRSSSSRSSQFSTSRLSTSRLSTSRFSSSFSSRRITYKTCINNSCVVVEGFGQDDCELGFDCDSECDGDSVPYFDECYANVLEPNPSDCCEKRTACVNDQCTVEYESGGDECTAEISCVEHTVCDGDQCKIVQGIGTNECDPIRGCGIESHTECRNGACVVEPGAGTNECNDGDDCPVIGSSSSFSFSFSSSSIRTACEDEEDCGDPRCDAECIEVDDSCEKPCADPDCIDGFCEDRYVPIVCADEDCNQNPNRFCCTDDYTCSDLVTCDDPKSQRECAISCGIEPPGSSSSSSGPRIECEEHEDCGEVEDCTFCDLFDDACKKICQIPFCGNDGFCSNGGGRVECRASECSEVVCCEPSGVCNANLSCLHPATMSECVENCPESENSSSRRSRRSSRGDDDDDDRRRRRDNDDDGDNDDGRRYNDDYGNGDNDDGIRGNGNKYVASASVCGDGVLEVGEECDDTNRRENDGCSSTCLLEIGICGDGIVQSLLGEQCENSSHDPSLSYTCSNCRFLSQSCGDTTVDAGEECDLGKLNSTSPNAACRPDCSAPRCGDGIIDNDYAEACDDGNRLQNDGCDRYCRIETKTQIASYQQQQAQQPYNSQMPTFGGIQGQFMQYGQYGQFGQGTFTQGIGFPQYPNYQQLPYQLPLAQLQPIIQSRGPAGDTGPAAVAVVGAGAAAGLSWIRRRRK